MDVGRHVWIYGRPREGGRTCCFYEVINTMLVITRTVLCVFVCFYAADTQLTVMTRQNKLEAMNHITDHDHEVAEPSRCAFLCRASVQ